MGPNQLPDEDDDVIDSFDWCDVCGEYFCNGCGEAVCGCLAKKCVCKDAGRRAAEAFNAGLAKAMREYVAGEILKMDNPYMLMGIAENAFPMILSHTPSERANE